MKPVLMLSLVAAAMALPVHSGTVTLPYAIDEVVGSARYRAWHPPSFPEVRPPAAWLRPPQTHPPRAPPTCPASYAWSLKRSSFTSRLEATAEPVLAHANPPC
jgi:hypothetical protein